MLITITSWLCFDLRMTWEDTLNDVDTLVHLHLFVSFLYILVGAPISLQSYAQVTVALNMPPVATQQAISLLRVLRECISMNLY